MSQELRLFFPMQFAYMHILMSSQLTSRDSPAHFPDVLPSSLSLVFFPVYSSFLFDPGLCVSWTLPGFLAPPFFLMKAEKSHRDISCDNGRTSPIYFLPLMDHSLLSSYILCLATHCIICLVCFIVVLGRRVNLMP